MHFFVNELRGRGEATSHFRRSLCCRSTNVVLSSATLQIKSSLKTTHGQSALPAGEGSPHFCLSEFSNSQKMWTLSVKVREKWVRSWIGIATDSPGRVRLQHGSYGWKLKDDTWCGIVSLLLLCRLCLRTCWTVCVPASVWFCWTAFACIWVVFMCVQLNTTSTKENHKTPGGLALRHCHGLNTPVERRTGGRSVI